ncbi:MAG: bifunctional phosphopantothenoylcysteine decarboxylase/phosphopantothenate--cysteine ligase CoaBC [Parvibaculaceae bacterium]
MADPLQNRRILLIIAGGIAAYKSLELVRRLRDHGASVRAVLTEAGSHFITPLTLATLTGDKVYSDLFDLTDTAAIGHIELSRDADLVVVVPATADLLAKMANGFGNDLATTLLLATDKPVLVAPAMNVRMWTHRATQRNVEQLMADGIIFVGPNEGDMACGEFGPGRMAEPAEILAAIEQHFSENEFAGEKPLSGTRVLVTSGPTHEAIDPVRYLANRSSGKQGHAIATALVRMGADVTLVSGPTNLTAPSGVTLKRVETAREMLAACENALPADVVICAAAVADWRVDVDATQKIKKEPGAAAPSLVLVENPDILATISKLKENRPALVIGFAAETEKVIEHAIAKRARKGCDWIVANDVSPETGVMGGDLNTVHLIRADGQEDWPLLPKQAVAERLARSVLNFMQTKKSKA